MYGSIILLVGAIFLYFGEGSTPPDNVYVFGLLLISVAAFYLIIIAVLKFTLYMMKMRGYIKDHDEKK